MSESGVSTAPVMDGAQAAGRSLQPERWPNGARVAVMLSVDTDNETDPLASGDTSIASLARCQYGARRGMGRILDILDKHGVPASFFLPCVSDALAPEMIDAIRRSGRHEIASHGWIHEFNTSMSEAEERQLLTRAKAYLEEVLGEPVYGYRAPWAIVSPHTISILQELGYLYDSSHGGDDTPNELIPSGMLELPLNGDLEDSTLDVVGEFAGAILAPRDRLDSHIAELDQAYKDGTTALVIMHPHVTGQRPRALVLDKLIAHMRSRDDVWFATHKQVAEYVLEEQGSK